MSKEVNDGGPAFPQKEPLSNDWHGMSLRDYFAAKAMWMLIRECAGSCQELARYSYQMADAMIAEREKQK